MSNIVKDWKADRMNNNLSVPTSLAANIQTVKQRTGESDDLIVRELRIGSGQFQKEIAIFYIDGLVEESSLQQFVLEPIMMKPSWLSEADKPGTDVLDQLKNSVLTVGQVQETSSLDTMINHLMNGSVVLLAEGYASGLQLPMPGWEQRSVNEPNNQTVIRGPKEAFTENIRVNTSLIRRIIKNPELVLRTRPIGQVTKTNVSLMYVNGIVDERALKQVNERLAGIDTDAILESGDIEEFIQDEPYITWAIFFGRSFFQALHSRSLSHYSLYWLLWAYDWDWKR